MNILDQINSPLDIQHLSFLEQQKLAEEIRLFLLENVSKTGGHLASNLGIVELTIALLNNFDFRQDKIVFDVGHQSYVYKILTDRKKQFATLRTYQGLSGFPKREESPYDYFDTGHSGNSISASLGMARARDLKGENYHIVTVIGDGAFTGGMVYEALNDVGYKNSKMLIILNDNQMSISKNVGGFSNTLNHVRLTPSYNRLKAKIRKNKSNGFVEIGRKVKNSIKSLFYKPMFFESLGVRYIGPVDGHDLKELDKIIKMIKNIREPVVLHVVTRKGQGYNPAMLHPDQFHAVGKFDLKTGESLSKKSPTYSDIFGDALLKFAKKDKRIVAISAAMISGTGLKKFQEEFPRQTFDVGITEEHAVSLAAGMATSGLKPVLAIYSTFLQRGFDQVLIDVCMQNLPVIFAIDRAGLVGSDGKTHQGIFDLSYLSFIPNLQILAPKCMEEIPLLLDYALSENGPIAIRYPRGGDEISLKPALKIKKGMFDLVSKGSQVVVLATGKMVQYAVLAKEKLTHYNPIIIHALFVKPLDINYLKTIVKNNYAVLTLEDNVKMSGFGSQVLCELNKLEYQGNLKMMGYPDHFIDHGSVQELMMQEHMDIDSICKEIEKLYDSIKREK